MIEIILHDKSGKEYVIPTELTFITKARVMGSVNAKNAQDLKDNVGNGIETLINFAYFTLKQNYADLTKEKFYEIADCAANEMGFAEFIEMLGYLFEDLFTQKATQAEAKVIPPYLAEKRRQAEMEKNIQSETVEEAPQAEVNTTY